MKNIRKFETTTERDAWLASDEYVSPNVVLTEGVVEYNLFVPEMIPLHIDALEDLTVSFSNTYEYSKDKKSWESGTSDTTISASAGEKVYFRASGLTPNSSSGIGTFTISNGTCNVAGNIMSMAYGAEYSGKTSITQTYQFYKLFQSCAKIVDASELILPATTLTNYCYYGMFLACSGLVSAPALPSMSLAEYCYTAMYKDCTSLVSVPILPAMQLARQCYYGMFRGCISLEIAPELPATTLVPYCYDMMFEGCTRLNYIKAMFTTFLSQAVINWVSGVSSSGTFVKNAAATWENTFGSSAIPSGWTVETAES